MKASEPRIMLGFHGTSSDIADKLISGEAFEPSVGDGDWLGYGAYFFVEFAGQRSTPDELALRIGRRRYGDDAVVLWAEIEEDGQLDLVADADAHALVRDVYRAVEPDLLPDQLAGAGLHPLDCYVVDYACELLEEAGQRVRTVRALLDEFPPLYPSTALIADPHIQVAVRDAQAIDLPAVY